jgi:hypothetical protein
METWYTQMYRHMQTRKHTFRNRHGYTHTHRYTHGTHTLVHNTQKNRDRHTGICTQIYTHISLEADTDPCTHLHTCKYTSTQMQRQTQDPTPRHTGTRPAVCPPRGHTHTDTYRARIHTHIHAQKPDSDTQATPCSVAHMHDTRGCVHRTLLKHPCTHRYTQRQMPPHTDPHAHINVSHRCTEGASSRTHSRLHGRSHVHTHTLSCTHTHLHTLTHTALSPLFPDLRLPSPWWLPAGPAWAGPVSEPGGCGREGEAPTPQQGCDHLAAHV